MLYSVIVPVFNRKKYIRRCLDSIIKQSVTDFEIIIVDDGSDDGTEKICDEYGQKYKNIRVIHQENAGASRARNVGLGMAEGEFAIFIDSDDYFPASYLSQIQSAYEKYGMDFLYCTSFKIYTECGTQFFQYKKSVIYSKVKGNGIFKLMDKGLFNSVVNKVYEMSVIKKYEIQFPEEISLGEDLIFNLRYLDKKKEFNFLILNKLFYIGWCKNTKGSLERGRREDYFKVQQRLLKEMVEYFNKWEKEEKIILNRTNILSKWYNNCIKESVEYYIAHMQNLTLVQLVRKIWEIMHSPEYSKCRLLCGERRGIIVRIICNIFYLRLKKMVRGEV